MREGRTTMYRVIVTVKREGEARGRDLEVPAEVKAQRLAAMIADALGWGQGAADRSSSFEIVVKPPGRALAPDETLADAGAWDGAWLILRRLREPSPPPPPPAEGPVKGWKRLWPEEAGRVSMVEEATLWPVETEQPFGEEPPGLGEVGPAQAGDESSESGDEGFVWRQID